MFVREIGMAAMQAIVANTIRNAWLMGLEDGVGVIATDKLADIVIWNSDPVATLLCCSGRVKYQPSSRVVGSSIVMRGSFRTSASISA